MEKNTNSEIRKEFLSQNYTRKIKVLVPLAVFRDSDMNFRLKGKELGGKGYVSLSSLDHTGLVGSSPVKF